MAIGRIYLFEIIILIHESITGLLRWCFLFHSAKETITAFPQLSQPCPDSPFSPGNGIACTQLPFVHSMIHAVTDNVRRLLKKAGTVFLLDNPDDRNGDPVRHARK